MGQTGIIVQTLWNFLKRNHRANKTKKRIVLAHKSLQDKK